MRGRAHSSMGWSDINILCGSPSQTSNHRLDVWVASAITYHRYHRFAADLAPSKKRALTALWYHDARIYQHLQMRPLQNTRRASPDGRVQ